MIELLKQARTLRITDPEGEVYLWKDAVFYTDDKGIHILQGTVWPWEDALKVEVDTGTNTETVRPLADGQINVGMAGDTEVDESGAPGLDTDSPGGHGSGAASALSGSRDAEVAGDGTGQRTGIEIPEEGDA